MKDVYQKQEILVVKHDLRSYFIEDIVHLLCQTLHVVITPRLPGSDYLFLQQCVEYQEKALWEASNGHIFAGKYLLRQVLAFATAQPLTAEASLLVQVLYEAAMASLDYKTRDFAQATTHVYRAWEIDYLLEKNYRPLHVHRIYLLHMLMKIHARRGHIQEVLETGFHLLDYLERKTLTLPGSLREDPEILQSFPSKLLDTVFAQITAEIASALADHSHLSSHYEAMISELITDHLCEKVNFCSLSPLAHAWLEEELAARS